MSTAARDLPVLGTLLPGFPGTTLPAWLDARVQAGLGGVCLFARNIASLPAVPQKETATGSPAASPDGTVSSG